MDRIAKKLVQLYPSISWKIRVQRLPHELTEIAEKYISTFFRCEREYFLVYLDKNYYSLFVYAKKNGYIISVIMNLYHVFTFNDYYMLREF
jgi:hypothetical protein